MLTTRLHKFDGILSPKNTPQSVVDGGAQAQAR